MKRGSVAMLFDFCSVHNWCDVFKLDRIDCYVCYNVDNSIIALNIDIIKEQHEI
jgi:hypothetical protein